MNKSESIKEIAAALCKAQGEMGGATKDKENPFFKKSYADFSSVIQVIKEPFANNGLSFAQFPIYEEGKAGVETILMHSSGEWLSGDLLLPVTKQDSQGSGIAITYAKRYSLQAIAGVPSEDDDGNSSSTNNSSPQQNKQPPKQAPRQTVVNHSKVVADYMQGDEAMRKRIWLSCDPGQKSAITEAGQKQK